MTLTRLGLVGSLAAYLVFAPKGEIISTPRPAFGPATRVAVVGSGTAYLAFLPKAAGLAVPSVAVTADYVVAIPPDDTIVAIPPDDLTVAV